MKKTDDVSGTHLWLVLMKTHRALQRLATRSIESSEVGLSDFAVLEMLLHKGPQPVNEIGRDPRGPRTRASDPQAPVQIWPGLVEPLVAEKTVGPSTCVSAEVRVFLAQMPIP